MLSAGWVQLSICHGGRSSSATSYLGPDFINRPNLHVLVDTLASRVLPLGSSNNTFRTVEFRTADGVYNDCLTRLVTELLSVRRVYQPNYRVQRTGIIRRCHWHPPYPPQFRCWKLYGTVSNRHSSFARACRCRETFIRPSKRSRSLSRELDQYT